MPGAVAHRVPSPRAGTSGSRARHGQGMVVVTDIAHEDTDLAVVDFSPVAAPLPFDAHRMRAAFGEAAGIEGEDAIGFPQPLGHLANQHRHQGAMIPWCDTD